MGGVDRPDRRVLMWSIALRTLRWYMKMFWHISDVAIANTNILFNIITMNNVNIYLMQQSIHSSSRNISDSNRNFKPCQSNKQMPKHVFIDQIIRELIPPLRYVLKEIHLKRS